ncbi:MAG: hypothetical protein ACYDH6_13160 [Acidimicrobiales bacterium]
MRPLGLLVGVVVLGGLALPPPVARADMTSPASPACDPIAQVRCLLPFPNDYYTVADSTPTGRRVQLPAAAMPVNKEGKAVDATEWNRNDGFSPGSALLAYVPSIDLDRTWGTTGLPRDRRSSLADLSRSLRPDSPVVVVDAKTGARQALWTELDRRQETPDDQRLLIVHPARTLFMGHHYVVALRAMRQGDGSIIPAQAAFAAYRDGVVADGRSQALEEDFATLQRAGISRGELFLAWDFTVASEHNLADRALRIRNDAFASLGDKNLADQTIDGLAPPYTVTKVTDFTPADDATTARRVEGTLSVPNYLTPDVQNGYAVPGSRFDTVGSPDGLPVRDVVEPDLPVAFVCDIPRGADKVPSHPLIYGHGLLGSKDEVNGGSAAQLRRHGFTTCATDWLGMSAADIPNFRLALTDLSNFASVTDRAQQGFVDFMFLGRLLAHPGGFAADAAFHTADGSALLAPGELAYAGNSQGAIMGGALTTLEPDVKTAVLGVPATDLYTLVFERSTDWYGTYRDTYESSYPDPIDEEIGFNLIQMVWDRGEMDGYGQHMTADPLPGTPTHQALLQVAFGDHQVGNVASEVEGRSIGAQLKMPSLRPGLHWSVDPTFGFSTVDRFPASGGSYFVYWYDPTAHDGTPPDVNFPDTAGKDPHQFPRRDNAAGAQAAQFLLTGQLIDTCGAEPCVTTPSTRMK